MSAGGGERGDGGDELLPKLREFEGRAATVGGVGRDPVNAPMIRHWCEAMGDAHPGYRGPDAVAPPTMLQAWTMGGLAGHAGRPGRSDTNDELFALLDGAGCTSVVATDCEQEYLRPLRLGDEITFDSMIESVSERKTTKLGTGYFITTRMDVRAGGELAGTHRFRILKYAPARRNPRGDEGSAGVGAATGAGRTTDTAITAGTATAASTAAPAAPVGPAETVGATGFAVPVGSAEPIGTGAAPRPGSSRPRPVVNRDNAGFWEGVGHRRLLIQRCTGCGTLRFPWLPGCNACGGPEWDTVEASGEGTVYSYVVMHHPSFPAFDPPYAVGLIELAEGVRMVSNVVGVPHDHVRVGMPVRLEFRQYDEELLLPVFRAGAGREGGGTAGGPATSSATPGAVGVPSGGGS
ncbi:bifunctional MaoC family dehydratase N-terminal/OB-fold nucleic acid binding domain-containing protein [Streptomyces sp. NBC_00687]|uniref:bifunctional MaoC family dehydratase N-terminal/OB-fold nucleic acid binding domain-containing protein n=1 Tax=Streptomyces sp. NBC_00687 TaxID=2975807 RepID=UPI0022521C66|nr:bifunctional MaoC family dehydratase N-terminal/OB-fold nucleic acid binding domain-containing protein [Streptomyces sp. NBC_00687]MCX4915726.1 OB-fold domain-containing protein [Streptomyces sp. NBC_00687]